MNNNFRTIYEDFLHFSLESYKNGVKISKNSEFSSYNKWLLLFEIKLYKRYSINYYME